MMTDVNTLSAENHRTTTLENTTTQQETIASDAQKSPQKALILGGHTGLLGQALMEAVQAVGWCAVALGREDINIHDSASIEAVILHHDPDVIFNAVAWTNVDGAEEQEHDAHAVNRAVPALLGRAIKGKDIHLVHFSTDFVFDGKKRSPYIESDETAALSVYGQSKLEGEMALLALDLDNCCIVRTAWLFGPHKSNFVQKIVELCKDRPEINVVHDQIGSPTYTPDLAEASVKLAALGACGVFHVANAGQASWCELASEAVSLAGLHSIVHAIPSSAWPQKATRPSYSVLDTSLFSQTTGMTLRPWPQALREYMFNAHFL